MYVGYISIGADDPFAVPVQQSVEVINNERAYAYARWAQLTWLLECDDCPGISKITSDGRDYHDPITDGAPWYDPNNPDSEDFLGVVGLSVTGASDSTRQANVAMGISGIGVIGPTYMAPRTMVVRALAIAKDDCALEFGLFWLRQQYSSAVNLCGGDPMTFFDCCPCLCEGEEGEGGPCWVRVYRELRQGPDACKPDFWPTTYAELISGPPADDDEWCKWPDIYRDLRTGPPPWSCCIDDCLVPYMRQFHNARVTAGPTILQRPPVSCGAFAEIEFTIVAADPVPHTMPFLAVREFIGGDPSDPIIDDPVSAPAPADPFAAVA